MQAKTASQKDYGSVSAEDTSLLHHLMRARNKETGASAVQTGFASSERIGLFLQISHSHNQMPSRYYCTSDVQVASMKHDRNVLKSQDSGN